MAFVTRLALVATVAVLCQLSAAEQWCISPECSSLELLAEFVQVDYDWTGSPFANREDAINQGAFIPENNLVTGVNFFQDTVFLCVPRWRSGVPSTLNTLQLNASTGQPYLRPYPNWEWQSKYLHYVQSVYVDRRRGAIWIIDTGRENFYNNDTSTIQNRAAGLIVLDIATETVLHNITFGDDIFPYNSSFLNDIRIDPSGTKAFMTDTNLEGHGAIVALDVTSGVARRISNPTVLQQPGFVVNVGGKAYPLVHAPSDGIAISPDGKFLFYSVITGSHLYRVPTSMLLDESVSQQDILDATTILYEKGTSSDGMDVVDVTSASASGTTTLAAIYGDFFNDSIAILRFPANSQVAGPAAAARDGSKSKQRMQWVDTIVADAAPNDPNSVVVYFTSNRLPEYVFWTMSFSGAAGANMRVWKMFIPREPSSAGGSGDSNEAPSWTIAVMASLGALLGAVLALYWVIKMKSPVSSTVSARALNRESLPLTSGTK